MASSPYQNLDAEVEGAREDKEANNLESINDLNSIQINFIENDKKPREENIYQSNVMSEKEDQSI